MAIVILLDEVKVNDYPGRNATLALHDPDHPSARVSIQVRKGDNTNADKIMMTVADVSTLIFWLTTISGIHVDSPLSKLLLAISDTEPYLQGNLLKWDNHYSLTPDYPSQPPLASLDTTDEENEISSPESATGDDPKPERPDGQ